VAKVLRRKHLKVLALWSAIAAPGIAKASDGSLPAMAPETSRPAGVGYCDRKQTVLMSVEGGFQTAMMVRSSHWRAVPCEWLA
jgi:hypothetical protein